MVVSARFSNSEAARGRRDVRVDALLRKPALAVPGWLALRRRAVGVRCLLLDTRPMPERSLVHGVATPVSARLVLTRTHGKDSTRCVSGSEDDVLRPGGA